MPASDELAVAPRSPVAFIVTGQCRPSPYLLALNDTAAATRSFISSYAEFVFRPLRQSHSTVFLLLRQELKRGPCGRTLCGLFSASACVHELLDDCPSLKLRTHKCFVQSTLAAWTPFWCTMWQAWTRVEAHERARAMRFERFVFSRVDELYSSTMGSWSEYTRPWHSAHAMCADVFWLFTERRMAACALTVFQVQVNCTYGEACCNRHWHASWWPWTFCTSPLVNPDVPHLYPVRGNLSLETRRGLAANIPITHCSGAPAATYDPPREREGAGAPEERSLLERPLSDASGKKPFYSWGAPASAGIGGPARGGPAVAAAGAGKAQLHIPLL